MAVNELWTLPPQPTGRQLVFSPIGFLQPAPSDEAKQGAFEAVLPSMPAYVPSLIWEIRDNMVPFLSNASTFGAQAQGSPDLSTGVEEKDEK
ncbi:hypothetical protein ACFLVX_01005 [Chloroflexota bacterium]